MALIINGEEITSTLRVSDYRTHGLEVKPSVGARPRDAEIDLFVLHWTAGEGSASQVFRVLQGRRLGIEFVIDRHGIIHQMCDPMKVSGLSIGRGRTFNPRQVGVEIVNYGFTWPRWRRCPERGRDRSTTSTKFKGMKLDIASFYPCQIEAAFWLVDAVTAAIPTIPRQVPREPSGELAHRTLTRAEKQVIKGIVGHYHLSSTKIDPGPALIETVAIHMKG